MLIPHGDIVDVIIYPNQHIVQRGWRNLTPREDKVDVIPQSTYCSEGVANFNVMMIMIMTIVSVEQRPGWGENVFM